MKNLCIIPARRGSKRLINKNKVLLNGKPLIVYTLEAAIKSKVFDDVVISSDDDEILKIADIGDVIIDKRSNDLAKDNVTTFEVVYEFINRVNNIGKYSTVTLLLPTSPLRNENHIREAFEKFMSNIEVNLISVSKYNFPIELCLIKKVNSEHYLFNNKLIGKTQSQNYSERFHPNGAIYISSINSFLKEKSFLANNLNLYKMDSISSIDINEGWELEIANLILKYKIKI